MPRLRPFVNHALHCALLPFQKTQWNVVLFDLRLCQLTVVKACIGCVCSLYALCLFVTGVC